VGEYNATGTPNPNFSITKLAYPYGIADSGNTLFVSDFYFGTVGEYGAGTGNPIHPIQPGFIMGLPTLGPVGLALSGNNLFVANSHGTVSKYDASKGTLIPSFGVGGIITGLNVPIGIALSGNDLFVANRGAGTVGKYDATTGMAIKAHFITGLNQPSGLAVSGNDLFVSNVGSGTVGKYDATTGLPNHNFTTITGLSLPANLAVWGNTLFVSNEIHGTVGEYDATTGMAIKAHFITGLSVPVGLAVAGTLPIANVSPNQTVELRSLVTLDGSASSDPTGQLPLTYAWSFVSKPAGSAATLSNPAIVNPTFTPDELGNYVLQLVVTDAAGLSSVPATVTISTTDAPPVANAGRNQTITAVGTLVQLNGSASYDLAGLPITYQWSFVSKPAGSNATLTGPTTATPSFVADVAGDYTLQLVVTDSLGTASSPAQVTISFSDVAPVANAGASQSTVVGESVTLNGSKSTDTNGAPLTYQWSVVSAPSGSKATISNPTAEIASFVPDLPGTYVVQLIVNDGTLNSVPATTEIVAVSQQTLFTEQIRNLQGVIANLPPIAFRNVVLKEALIIELNAVVLSLEAKDYKVALLVLQDVILPEVNECATTGAPGNGWINNCPDQSMVYTHLLNIIAEVKALCGC
jgi:PKD domain